MSFIIASNWKMNKGPQEAEIFFKSFLSFVLPDAIETYFFVPALSLQTSVEILAGTTHHLGVQNTHFEVQGAWTGENSARVVSQMGGVATLLGHSERRQYFLEDNLLIQKKIETAQKEKLKTILCVGETLEQRKKGQTHSILIEQLEAACLGLTLQSDFHIAYEPVWAIGTGEVASENQVAEAHRWIREFLKQRFLNDNQQIKILYGGSVKPDNAKALSQVPEVGGFLIGGASLIPESLYQIIQAVGG